MMPVLSVCIPTYNRSKLAYRCVKKVLEYAGDDIEVIVSDNGSEDDTYEMLVSINDKRLRVSRNVENEGIYRNIMKVLRLSNTNFSMLMSDEDEVLLDGLAGLVKYLTANPKIGFVSCGMVFFKRDGSDMTYPRCHNYNDSVLSGVEAYSVASQLGVLSGIVLNRTLIDFNREYDKDYPHMDIAKSISFKAEACLLKEAVLRIYPVSEENFSDELLIGGYPGWDPRALKIFFEREVNSCLESGFSENYIITLCRYYLFHYRVFYVLFMLNAYKNGQFGREKYYKSFEPDYFEKLMSNIPLLLKETLLDGFDYLSKVQKNPIWTSMKEATLFFGGEEESDKNKMFENLDRSQWMRINCYGVLLAQLMMCNNIEIKDRELNALFKKFGLVYALFSDGEYDAIIALNCKKTMQWYFYAGKSYMALGNIDLAINCMEEYVRQLEDGRDLFMPCTGFEHISSMLFYLGKLYLQKNENEKAKYFLEKCQSFHREMGEIKHMACEKLLKTLGAD